jgi:hypothetical protein
MKTPIFSNLKVFCACAILAGACLSAQTGQQIIANVPFDFAVMNQHMRAGSYTVTTNLVQGTVLIRGEENNSAMFALTIPAQAPKIQIQAKLVFNRYGDRYFLTQVWPAATDQGRQLHTSKAEQELARTAGKPEIVALLAPLPKSPTAGR